MVLPGTRCLAVSPLGPGGALLVETHMSGFLWPSRHRISMQSCPGCPRLLLCSCGDSDKVCGCQPSWRALERCFIDLLCSSQGSSPTQAEGEGWHPLRTANELQSVPLLPGTGDPGGRGRRSWQSPLGKSEASRPGVRGGGDGRENEQEPGEALPCPRFGPLPPCQHLLHHTPGLRFQPP